MEPNVTPSFVEDHVAAMIAAERKRTEKVLAEWSEGTAREVGEILAKRRKEASARLEEAARELRREAAERLKEALEKERKEAARRLEGTMEEERKVGQEARDALEDHFEDSLAKVVATLKKELFKTPKAAKEPVQGAGKLLISK